MSFEINQDRLRLIISALPEDLGINSIGMEDPMIRTKWCEIKNGSLR